MLRTWRNQGGRAFGLLAAATLCAAGVSADASDEGFEPQTTLAPQVAPQALSLDAAIDSMLRRGMLANVKGYATARPPANAITPPPTLPVPITPTPGAPPSTGWRPTRSALAEPRSQSPEWRPTLRPALIGPTESAPALEAPGPAFELLATPELEAPDATNETSSDPPTNVALEGPIMPLLEAPAPELIASLPDEPVASEPLADDGPAVSDEPTTSDDPLPDDHLAPIDELPETPAPTDDSPGDPVEPEIGDSDLENMLLPPDSSSLSGLVMTPVGEPDRIEQPDESVAPPSDPETYQEPEEIPQRALRPLNSSQVALRDKVRRVLKYYYDHPLSTSERSPWEVMHCMLSYEVHSRVLKGGPNGQPITAVGWLCFNQPCKGRTLMYLNGDGAMRVKVGPALQGHHGQLLALAQARVRSDYPMRVEGKEFTVADLIESEKLTCYPKTELTFKLLALNRYLPQDAKWVNDQGMQWDFPTLLREEMAQPVRTAACGGSHRLSGLILAVKRRQRDALPIDGDYAAAQKFVANYQNYAYRLQNNDGSFSTEWFKGPGAEADIDRRLKTTGHQLEFLIYAADEGQLTYYRTVRAVNYLSNIMWANRGREWEAGPLGHAIHALVLYDRFVFAPYDNIAPEAVAQQPVTVRQTPTAQPLPRKAPTAQPLVKRTPGSPPRVQSQSPSSQQLRLQQPTSQQRRTTRR